MQALSYQEFVFSGVCYFRAHDYKILEYMTRAHDYKILEYMTRAHDYKILEYMTQVYALIKTNLRLELSDLSYK